MFPQWWSDLHDSFITDNIFPDKKVPLNFGSHADFRSESFLDRMRLGRGLRQTEVWRWSVLCVSTILIFSGGAAPGQMTFWKIHRPGSVLLSPAYCVASVIVWTENKNVTIDRFIYFIWTRPLKRKGASGWPGWRIFRPGSFWHWRRHCLSCLCTLWGRKVASPQENFLQYFYSQWTYVNENYLGYCSTTFLRLYQLLSIDLNICMNCVILTSKTTQILTNQFSSSLVANNIGSLLYQYWHIGYKLADVTILVEYWTDTVTQCCSQSLCGILANHGTILHLKN